MNIKKTYIETFLGFLVVIIIAFCILQIYHLRSGPKIGDGFKANKYKARFHNIEGIATGAAIKIGGVSVGEVKEITVDKSTYQVIVTVNIDNTYNIPSDSILAVSSSGLLGGKYIEIKPGSGDDNLKDGDFFESTQSAVSLEDMLAKLAFSMGGNKSNDE